MAHLPNTTAPKIGQIIEVKVSEPGCFSAGDRGVLTQNEGASGWWADFDGNEWNVGSGLHFEVVGKQATAAGNE